MHIGAIMFSVCSKRDLVQKWKFLFMYDLKVCLSKNVEDLFGKWIGAKKENYFHFFFDAKMENYFCFTFDAEMEIYCQVWFKSTSEQ